MKFFIKDSCGFPQFPVDSVILPEKLYFYFSNSLIRKRLRTVTLRNMAVRKGLTIFLCSFVDMISVFVNYDKYTYHVNKTA